ncbi:MAG: hypothetical protein CME06_10750 [Gemmatimonadetes bacterium]|nr:hypothetical protein [Gemmatimonadota bacterium]
MSVQAGVLLLVAVLLAIVIAAIYTTQRVLFGPLVDLLEELRVLRRAVIRPMIYVWIEGGRYHISNEGALAAEGIELAIHRNEEGPTPEFTLDLLRPGASHDTGVAAPAPEVLCRVRYGSIHRHYHYRTDFKDGRNAVMEGQRQGYKTHS